MYKFESFLCSLCFCSFVLHYNSYLHLKKNEVCFKDDWFNYCCKLSGIRACSGRWIILQRTWSGNRLDSIIRILTWNRNPEIVSRSHRFKRALNLHVSIGEPLPWRRNHLTSETLGNCSKERKAMWWSFSKDFFYVLGRFRTYFSTW